MEFEKKGMRVSDASSDEISPIGSSIKLAQTKKAYADAPILPKPLNSHNSSGNLDTPGSVGTNQRVRKDSDV